MVPEDGSIANNKRQANMEIGEVQISISWRTLNWFKRLEIIQRLIQMF
jgi:hypothetical protein